MLLIERFLPVNLEEKSKSTKKTYFISTLVNVFLSNALGKIVVVAIFTHTIAQLYELLNIDFAWPRLLPLQIIIAWLIADFFRYAIHRFQHTNIFLWRLHSMHHSVENLEVMNLYLSHPLDYFLRNVLPATLISFLGFAPEVVIWASGLTIVSGAFSHSGAKLHHKWLGYIFITNSVHRWHHSKAKEHQHCNFGVTLSLWDHIFRTFHYEPGRSPKALGLISDSGLAPTTYWRSLFSPFKKGGLANSNSR